MESQFADEGYFNVQVVPAILYLARIRQDQPYVLAPRVEGRRSVFDIGTLAVFHDCDLQRPIVSTLPEFGAGSLTGGLLEEEPVPPSTGENS